MARPCGLLDLEPGEMLKATACATLIEALRSEGRYGKATGSDERLLDEGTSNFSRTIAYYEMAYNLAEMEEDLDQGLGVRSALLGAGAGRAASVSFGSSGLGSLQDGRSSIKRSSFWSVRVVWESSVTTLTHLGMALLASGCRGPGPQACWLRPRSLDRGAETSVEQKMMECLKTSSRLHGQSPAGYEPRSSPHACKKERVVDALESVLPVYHQ